MPDHLRARGLIATGETPAVTPLVGGVSAEVFAVHAARGDCVVKRARARLDVADTWLADPLRVVTEARALETVRPLAPRAVPRVLDLDVDAATLVIERAPATWRDWRSTLLAGAAGDGVAAWLGEALATWHRGTAGVGGVADRFGSRSGFEELRLAPFHATIAAAHPDLADRIAVAVDRLRGERACLVHGDFSPKNVLHGEGGAWVLDWEVAHYGAPIFDLAFMLAHLTLKIVHRPADADLYRGLAADFMGRYAARGGLVAPDDPALDLHVGCLLLARVDGKSPAGYLTSAERGFVRAVARGLTSGELGSDPHPRLWEISR